MIRKLSTTIALLILSNLSGCADQRVIASSEVPQTKPPTPALRVPGPDPLLFEQCKTELIKLDQTSGPGLTPSCKQLDDWRRSTVTSSDGNENQ